MNSKNSAEISDETSYSVLNTAKMGIISGVLTAMVPIVLLWGWFFIRTTTVEEMEHLIGVPQALCFVNVGWILVSLLSGSLGGIVGGYIGYPSRQRGSVIGGVLLTITLIILSPIGYNIGFSNYSEQQAKRALTTLDLQIEQDPNNAMHYWHRGGVYYRDIRDYEQAIADYTKAIELNPNYLQVYNARGDAYFSAKNYEQAIADYTQVIELNPDESDFYSLIYILLPVFISRGDAYREVDQLEKALKDYEQALELRRGIFF